MNGVLIRGAVDRLDNNGAAGWLYGAEYHAAPTVRAFLYQEMIGAGVADGYRPDLEQVGFGDGRCGFEIRFDRPIDTGYLPFVSIKPENVDLLLPMPQLTDGFRDLVDALIAGYQGTGRHHSVLGGLWTDRMDAPQLLAGRVAVGTSAAELQPALQSLIHDGYVVLLNALAPNGVNARDLAAFRIASNVDTAENDAEHTGALTTVAGLLFREHLVRLLRTVFDDHPVAYRFDLISGGQEYTQVSSIEDLPSPAECVAVYIGNPTGTVRLECVRDSHELPEFGASGLSRWTREGAAETARFAANAGLSVQRLDLDGLDVAIVGAGMMHRIVAESDSPALRIILAPRRVTPRRFLRGNRSWSEVGHVSGARIRV